MVHSEPVMSTDGTRCSDRADSCSGAIGVAVSCMKFIPVGGRTPVPERDGVCIQIADTCTGEENFNGMLLGTLKRSDLERGTPAATRDSEVTWRDKFSVGAVFGQNV